MNNNKSSLRSWSASALLALCALYLHLHSSGAQAHSLLDNSFNSNHKLAQNNGNPTKASNNYNQQNRCPLNWMWFNNKCVMSTNSRRDFNHAVELCKKMYDSTLPTIHSGDENEFLRQNVDLHQSPIWIYAKHSHQHNKTRWLDKSPVDYTSWESGQPSNKSSLICIQTEESWYMKKAEPNENQTECVSFWEDAKWGTQVGCLMLLPVICEKRLDQTNRLADHLSSPQGVPPMETSFGAALSCTCSSFHHFVNYLPTASLFLHLTYLFPQSMRSRNSLI